MTTTSIDHIGQDPQSALAEITLHRVLTEADRKRWRAGFIGAYQTVFARAPYYERFTPAEAEGVWLRLTSLAENITFVAATRSGKVVGFASAIPLRHQRSVARELTGLINIAKTFYFAELGVLPEYRGQGLGKALIRARLAELDPHHYRGVVLRAPASRDSFDLYAAMGFQDTGVTMSVPNLRVDGRVTTDTRTFLYCVLSQVRLDDGTPLP
jgi:GNAT superfamily N-acetyltransferase